MKEKGFSKGEYNSIKQAVGGLEKMLNPKCKDKDALAMIQYIADEDKDEEGVRESESFIDANCKEWETGNSWISAGSLERVEIDWKKLKKDERN